MAKILIIGNYSQIIEENDSSFLSALDTHLSWKIPGAEHMRAFKGFFNRKTGKFERWDGLSRILTKSLMFPSGLIPRVQKFYQSSYKEVEIVDKRSAKTPFQSLDIGEKLVQLGKVPYDYQLDTLEKIKKSDRGILKICTGGGKCSDIESLHVTEEGLLNYKELLDGVSLVKGDIYPFKTKVSTPIEENNADYSSHIYYDGYSKSRKIINSCGYELTATFDHKIKILNESGDIVWKRFEDLKVGDYTVINSETNIFGKNSIDLDDAYWYGLLLGDGGMSRRNRVTITNMDNHILSFCRNYLNKNNLKFHEKRKNNNGILGKATDIVICSIPYRNKLKKLGFDYCLSITKELPIFVRKLSKESLGMVIRGLYETDGWVGKSKGKNKPTIEIGLSNKKIIDQIHLILLNFGIIAHRRVKKTKKQDSHLLCIYNDYIPIFMEKIGFDPNGRKFATINNELLKNKNTIKNSNVNIIPFQKENLSKIINPFIFKRNFWKNSPIKRRTVKSWMTHRNPSKRNLEVFLQWFKKMVFINEHLKIINNLISFCSNKLFFAPIKSITETFSDNYDFVVPKTHSFVSQGFINHNTLIGALTTAHFNQKTIVYVIGKDLLYQFYNLFHSIFGKRVGIVGDGHCEISDFNIVSVWTAGQAFGLKKNELLIDSEASDEKLNLGKKSEIINLLKTSKVNLYDECHMVAGNTIQSIYKNSNPEYIYGLSGTPWRDDNADLLIEGMLGDYIVDIPASKLIEKDFLAKPIIKFVNVPPLVGEESTNYQKLYKEYIVENSVRNNLIVKSTKSLVSSGYQTLVLFNSISHGKILFDLLNKELRCAILDGSDDQKTRERIKDDLLNKRIDCVIASKIFDIGVDIPSLSGLVLAGGGKSSVKCLQRIGRVIRKYPGKKRAAVVDFVDNCKFLEKHSKIRYKVYKSEDGFDVSWPGKKDK